MPLHSGAPPGPSHYPPGAGYPTTQSTWQHRTDAGPHGPSTTGERRGKSGVVVAVLGVLTGLFLLAIVGTGGWWYLNHKESTATLPAVVADAGVPAVVPSATSSMPATPAMTVSVPDAPTAPASATAKPVAIKDAGAPAAKKDAGPPAPPPPNKDDELEAKRQSHTAFCQHHQFLMSRPNPTQSTLQQVKTSNCLSGNGADGARCQRDLCRQACLLLKDQPCLLQLDAANRNYPPKY